MKINILNVFFTLIIFVLYSLGGLYGLEVGLWLVINIVSFALVYRFLQHNTNNFYFLIYLLGMLVLLIINGFFNQLLPFYIPLMVAYLGTIFFVFTLLTAKQNVILVDTPLTPQKKVSENTKKITIISHHNIMNILSIENKPETPSLTFVLVIDIVGFSKKEPHEQLHLFEEMLRIVKEQVIKKEIDTENAVILLTGDGLALVLNDKEKPEIIYEIANDIRKNTINFEMTFGIHCGNAYWIKMQNQTMQIIGDAINWAFRVQTAAQAKQILISKRYWEEIDRVPKYNKEFVPFKFEEGKQPKTKHGELIFCYIRQ
jgi:hypothetical protein